MKWIYKQIPIDSRITELSEKLGKSEPFPISLANILVQRGIDTFGKARKFLKPGPADLPYRRRLQLLVLPQREDPSLRHGRLRRRQVHLPPHDRVLLGGPPKPQPPGLDAFGAHGVPDVRPAGPRPHRRQARRDLRPAAANRLPLDGAFDRGVFAKRGESTNCTNGANCTNSGA